MENRVGVIRRRFFVPRPRFKSYAELNGWLLDRCGRHSRLQQERVEIAFPLSRQDLAEMSGTTLHTASRTLSAWEEQGLIDSGRRRVVVCDPAGLRALADQPAQ